MLKNIMLNDQKYVAKYSMTQISRDDGSFKVIENGAVR